MVKTYTAGETKAERKARKNKIKAEKAGITIVPATQPKYFLLSLKHGKKYSSEYVNRLYDMVSRNCTLDYQFVCLTDDPKGLNGNIVTHPLPPELTGWWCKPYMFSKDLPIKGTILYMDLDIILSGNIDELFTYKPGRWCAIRDFTRKMRPGWVKYNSSIVRFDTGQLDHVWTGFKKGAVNIMKRMHGDQDWLYEADKNAIYWPDDWILSWKWEIRRDKQFLPGGMRGDRKFKIVEHCKPPETCKVCVFHGDPNPHNCDDPWVVENWK